MTSHSGHLCYTTEPTSSSSDNIDGNTFAIIQKDSSLEKLPLDSNKAIDSMLSSVHMSQMVLAPEDTAGNDPVHFPTGILDVNHQQVNEDS